MSKRKRSTPSLPAAKPLPAPVPAAKPGSKTRPRRVWVAVLILVVLVAGSAAALFVLQPFRNPPPIVSGEASTKYQRGSVTYCVTTQAPFIAALGFSRQAVIDTRSQTIEGLQIDEPDQNGNPTRSYQHPTWKMGGFLGPVVVDVAGNIYSIPVPAINVLDNPLAKANIVYKIDAATGIMAELLKVPAAAPPTPENPYGVLGLAYDCDTNSLYVTSVFGSTRDTEVGRLFRIDLTTQKVTSQINDTDAFGLTVYNGVHGKRLYYGLARSSDVRSIALDDTGNFQGGSRREFSFPDKGYHGNEHARRMSIDDDETMTVRITQFDYNLVAPTELNQTGLTYHYDATHDTWSLINTFSINN